MLIIIMNDKNINNYDLYFSKLGSIINSNKNDYKDIRDDVILYKKEIKNKFNKLFNKYVDLSDNVCETLNNLKTEKYKKHFYYFLSNLIEEIKHIELRKNVQNDLSNISLYNDIDISNISNINDINNNIIEINKVIINNDKYKKKVTLDNMIIYNEKDNIKILPQKKNFRKSKK